MMWLFGMARGTTETLFSLNNDLTCEVDEYTIMKEGEITPASRECLIIPEN